MMEDRAVPTERKGITTYKHFIGDFEVDGDRRVVDKAGNVLFERWQKEISIPDKPAPPTVIKSIVVDPANPVWQFYEEITEPTACWLTEEHKLIRVSDEKEIGFMVAPPADALCWSGDHNREDVWARWRENAETWFDSAGYIVTSLPLPRHQMVLDALKKPQVYYAIAHGAWNHVFFAGRTLSVSEVEPVMAERPALNFAFCAHCDALTRTGPGTWSHLFRKGQEVGTVVVGYVRMGRPENRDAWIASRRFQDVMFKQMVENNATVGIAHEYALSIYPECENVIVFDGDQNLRLEVTSMKDFEVHFVLERETVFFRVFGTVLEKNTNTPIQGATVSIVEKALSATTDASGFYEIRNVEGGTYTISCVAEGYKSKSKQITLS